MVGTDWSGSNTRPNTDQATDHSKPCTLCGKRRDVLVRCQIDPSEKWHFVCPGSCWRSASGGVQDGTDEHISYRYGGMWKNKHEAVSAKKPKKGKRGTAEVRQMDMECENEFALGGEAQVHVPAWIEAGARYTRNDRVLWAGVVYDCRKSHTSEPGNPPSTTYSLWKEHKS